MTSIQKPLAELSEEAVDVLVRQLGLADTVRFLRQFTGGLGDYTRERQAQSQGTLEEVTAAIRARRETVPPNESTSIETRKEASPQDRLQAIRQKHKRAYEPWTTDEEEELVEKYTAGESIQVLAEHFGRQPGAIRSRLQRLGLIR